MVTPQEHLTLMTKTMYKNVSFFYKNEYLFQKHNTVRFHKGFEEVINSIHVKEPQKLQCRFTKYSIGLDKEKYVCGY